MIHVTLENSTQEVRRAFENACRRGLLVCGETAEGYAKQACPVDTGALRNSINHGMTDDTTVQIGTNMEYAAYVELGTGVYYPGGRTDPWRYQDWRGDWHITAGSPAQPYLKPAVADHGSDFRMLILDSLKNA